MEAARFLMFSALVKSFNRPALLRVYPDPMHAIQSNGIYIMLLRRERTDLSQFVLTVPEVKLPAFSHLLLYATGSAISVGYFQERDRDD